MEIFFDPHFYDLEILIVSRDAPETRHHANSYNSIDMATYKGSKRIFAEMQPGDYTFKVIAKTAPTS